MRLSCILQPTQSDTADVPDSVELPVASLIQGESNCMSRDVQTQLRKKTYAFARADTVLTDLGVRNTWRGPKKSSPDHKGQKRQQGEAAATTDANQPASKRACVISEDADSSQAVAQAADAAADARAESILHVPETSAFPTGTANSSNQLNGHIPDNSASSAIPPGQEPMSNSLPPAAQTSLAAAAAAALGGQPAPATDGSSGLQAQGSDPDAAKASDMNGHASNGVQRAEGEPAKLYDVNR